MTKEAQTRGPGDLVFRVAGDSESPLRSGQGLAHGGGRATPVSWVTRKSESWGTKAHQDLGL